jgi:hypothetical protein
MIPLMSQLVLTAAGGVLVLVLFSLNEILLLALIALAVVAVHVWVL